jgi:dimethylaniline monooxygenase (N-oxide forming)
MCILTAMDGGIGREAGKLTHCQQDLSERSTVYFSHRRGLKICPRIAQNGPVDSILTYRFTLVTSWISEHVPKLYGRILDAAVRRNIDYAFGPPDPAWGFEPSPSIANGFGVVMINDHIIPLIRQGKITPVAGVKRITGPKAVELTDGTILNDVDVIIACTGYMPTTKLVEGVPQTTIDSRVGPLPDLYQNMFPLSHPNSLAFLDWSSTPANAATLRELMAMAVAQVWTGKSTLPPRAEMAADILAYQRWFTRRKLAFSSTAYGLCLPRTFQRFIHNAAGTGVDEYLGWGWKGWTLWWNDRKLYHLAAWGVYSPHIFRLFETGKRPAWDGAREALIKANELYQQDWGKNGKLKTT